MRFTALALILAASPALTGLTVTDGDTIRVDGITYRLHGIDAMESRQLCGDGLGRRHRGEPCARDDGRRQGRGVRAQDD